MRRVNSNAKLTHEDVEMIRQLNEWKDSEIQRIRDTAGNRALAEKFGVSQTCIQQIVHYKTW
jgi:hypothetical protein